MNSQSNGRNQRSKGFKVKQALQLVVLLVICIWLLYQLKNSNNDNKEQNSLSLGRKVDTGRFKNKTDPKNKNFNIHASREDQKEPEREYKESQKVGNLIELVKGEENDEKNPSSKGTLVKSSDEDKGPTNITISFNDENGIPQDLKEEQRGNFYDEKGDKSALEDSESELTSDGEQEKSRDVEDSQSASVHQDLEEVIEKSTSQQDE